jgi:PIN domain nuclease of toxin-antitoxin system
MKYLLDTHTAICALGDNSKLSQTVAAIIADTSVSLSVSIVSAWEIAIKVSLGKLNFEGGSGRFLEKMRQNGVELLNLNGSHIKCLEKLPLIHRDPFDRVLVATAKTENMTLLTADKNIPLYDVLCVW